MRMNWFRLYHEARNDAKLRTLSDAQFRVWFNLLCLASEQRERGTIQDYDKDLLSIEVAGGDGDLLQGALRQLQRLRIIHDDGTAIVFCNFMDRQYDKPSDRPTAVKERVTKHRSVSNKEGETPSNAMKRVVTHIQEENIQEDIRGEENKPARAKAARPFPPDFEITDAMRLWAKKNVAGLDILAATEQWADAMRSNTAKYKYTDWEAAWRTGMKRALEWGHGGNGNGTTGQGTGRVKIQSPQSSGTGQDESYAPGLRRILEERASKAKGA